MSNKKKKLKPPKIAGYTSLVSDVTELLETARRASARAINTFLTATYWEIGRRIVEFEQKGRHRAGYGEQAIERLAIDLTTRFGKGFGRSNLFQIRSFYLAYSDIFQTMSGKSKKPLPRQKVQTVSGQLLPALSHAIDSRTEILADAFPLSWSHYVRLLSVEDKDVRSFYEKEALRGGWSVRQLDRQIATRFFERTLLSKNKHAMLKKVNARTNGIITPEEEIKDPYVLEFLGLKDEYSENDLEEALIQRLEHFLLELGDDFAFVGKQKRLRIGREWYRIDLLFFHRKLKCLVVIDLKVGKFTHADAGQMHLYLNYAREHWMHEDENPPVGLILCAEKDAAVARYALNGLANKVLAAEYKLQLPNERKLIAELQQTRKRLETGHRKNL
ncbi:DUF1016 domain-containing protein [bacterium]|nr:DUF1016 domain-containing protein [bacterium]